MTPSEFTDEEFASGLVADSRCAAITFVEHNPDHCAADGSTTRALVRALAGALAKGQHK